MNSSNARPGAACNANQRVVELRARAWLKTRQEAAELRARLQCLKLLQRLGVRGALRLKADPRCSEARPHRAGPAR